MENLSTFERCKSIRNLLLSRIGENLVYDWNPEYKSKSISEIPSIIHEWEKNYGSFKINPNDLNLEEIKKLEFGLWSKDSDLRLIPIWLFPFLADEFECQSISGEKYSKLSEINNDNRMGYLAYGIIPK